MFFNVQNYFVSDVLLPNIILRTFQKYVGIYAYLKIDVFVFFIVLFFFKIYATS